VGKLSWEGHRLVHSKKSEGLFVASIVDGDVKECGAHYAGNSLRCHEHWTN